MVPTTATGKPASVSLRYKVLIYVAAWIVALLATDPSCGLLALAWMFPLGLARLVLPPGTGDSGWTVFGVCWGIYVVQAVLFFRSKSLRWTIIWFVLLVLLLVSNVAGCRDMIHAH